MMWRFVMYLALAPALLGACSPALDWRELRPEGSGVEVQFPCKPDRHARTVPLAGLRLRMEMLVCGSDGATFALSFVDVAEPAAVGRVLDELRVLTVANIGGGETAVQALQVPGMTPNPKAVRLSVVGRLPGGAAVQQHAAFFSKGLRVYQASVVGAKLSKDTSDIFFGALRLPA